MKLKEQGNDRDLYPVYRFETTIQAWERDETLSPYGVLDMAGHCGHGGIKREGIMSREEGANQWMFCGGVCMDMQMNERDRLRQQARNGKI